MSFFKDLRTSLESEDVLNEVPVTVEEEAEADVAAAEAEVVRQQAEADIESVERAEAVVSELEGTNEALTAAVTQSEDNTITPVTAAMVEAQRRTAAVALGLDPEEGAGAELVDEAGLEGLVSGTVSVEDAAAKLKEFKAKVDNFIKEVRAKIKLAMEKFSIFLGKIFNVLPRQLAQLAVEFKPLNGKVIDERLANVSKEDKLAVGRPMKYSDLASTIKLINEVGGALSKGDTEHRNTYKNGVIGAGNKNIVITDPDKGVYEVRENTPHEVTGEELKIMIEHASKVIPEIKKMDSAALATLKAVSGAEYKILGFDFTKANIDEANKVRAYAMYISRHMSLVRAFESNVLAQLRAAVKVAKQVVKEPKAEEAKA